MARHGRKFLAARTKVDRTREYTADEGIALVKQLSRASFDESVEVHIRTGLNVRHAEEQLRGTIALPHGLGKSVTIAVFAAGDKAAEAEAAGADFVGTDDLAKKIEEGFSDFDVVIATPDQMPLVGRLGRVLGPQGKMPNPKVGTVTVDVAKAVEESKAGKVEYRTDRTAIVHMTVGKTSFPDEHLLDNYQAVLEELARRDTGLASRLGHCRRDPQDQPWVERRRDEEVRAEGRRLAGIGARCDVGRLLPRQCRDGADPGAGESRHDAGAERGRAGDRQQRPRAAARRRVAAVARSALHAPPSNPGRAVQDPRHLVPDDRPALRHQRQAASVPLLDSAGERPGVEALTAEGLGGHRGAATDEAHEDDGHVPVEPLDLGSELVHRDVGRSVDPSGLPLVGLTDVDQDEPVLRLVGHHVPERRRPFDEVEYLLLPRNEQPVVGIEVC